MAFNPDTFFQMLKPELALKIGILIFLALFGIFQLVLNRQVSSLNRIVHESFIGGLLQLLGLILFLATLVLFIIALMIL